MLNRTIKQMRRRLGPVGLSVAAAALTAVAFAAVSVAKDDGSESEGVRAPDRQALESFKQCMEDQGAPAPPRPGALEEGERPEPPSEAERAKIHEALEACRDELPEGVRPPGPHCGPPPGAGEEGKGGGSRQQ